MKSKIETKQILIQEKQHYTFEYHWNTYIINVRKIHNEWQMIVTIDDVDIS